MKCIKNANVYVEGEGVISTSVSFDKRIISIGETLGEEILLPTNCVVVPGFIDQHIHGAGGADFMDGEESTVETISTTLAKEGTVAYLATTVSASVEKTKRALQSLKEYRGKNQNAALFFRGFAEEEERKSIKKQMRQNGKEKHHAHAQNDRAAKINRNKASNDKGGLGGVQNHVRNAFAETIPH